MNNDLIDRYYTEYLHINPPIYDLEKKQPNIYANEFIKEIKQLRKKYIRMLKNKSNLTLQEKILLHDLQYGHKIHPFFPITLYSNRIIDYWEESKLSYSETRKLLFIQKSKALYEITSSIIRNFTKGISSGNTLHKMIVIKMIENYDTLLKQGPLEIQVHIINNLQVLRDYMKHKYIKHASSSLGLYNIPGGEQDYRKLVEKNTFSMYTPDQIYKYGKQELQRLMKIKKSLGTIHDIDDIDDYVRKNMNVSHDVISDMNKIKTKLYKSYTSFFNSETIPIQELYSIQEIPQEEVYRGVYYKYDNKKGVVYIDNNMNISKEEMIVLSLHEGIPGHHLHSHTYEKDKKIHEYFKNQTYNGYTEGWAFYSESLYEYETILEYYFKLQYDIFRTVRLVVDVGIHLYDWSFIKSFTYMKQYVSIFSDEYLQAEILRYSCIPGQALSYKICGSFFHNLKDYFVERHHMNIRTFHEIVLRNTPGPINILGNVIINELREAL